MTVREIYNKLDQMDEELRAVYLGKLFDMLCPVSQSTIRGYQDDHFLTTGAADYDEFVKGQNKEFKTCLDLEMHDIGKTVRSVLKLPELTWDTEVQP